MARDSIVAATRDVVSDDGAVEISVAKGEQLHVRVELDWVTDLTGYNVHARAVEAANDGTGDVPSTVKQGGVTRLLTRTSGHVRDFQSAATGAAFTLVLPWDLSDGFDPQPQPGADVFAFFDMEVGEPDTGDDVAPIGDSAAPDKQVWKPLRGIIRLMYSPTED